jgi:hypothetical protein
MMLSNIIKTGGSLSTDMSVSEQTKLKAKMGAKFLNFFHAEVGSDIASSNSDSQKVLETFEIKTTKSIILDEIIERSQVVNSFEDIEEGSLIKIDNVILSLENEMELRTVKLFANGSFKGMKIPQAGGLDINNLFNSIFKDYSYKLKGQVKGKDTKILIKIPLTFESEFESSYSVDDLFIGKVTVIGIYKGTTKIDKLKNSFEYFQELGNSSNHENQEIHDSQYTQDSSTFKFKSEDDNEDYSYIDVLAIVQSINPKEDIEK